MKFRLASIHDAHRLAEIHYMCRDDLHNSFMCAIGPSFLKAYYKEILSCPVSVVLGMVNADNVVTGFTVCSLDAQSQFAFLEQRKLALVRSMVFSLILRPKLLPGVLLRRRMMRGDSGSAAFIVLEGARNEFLAIDAQYRNGPHAMILMKKTLDLIRVFGVSELWIEVDTDNPRATRFHEMLGAKHVRKTTLPSGTIRQIMCYSLKQQELP